MAGPENNRGSSSMDCGDDPPALSVTLNKLRDLPKKTRRWSNDHSPVDILLLTVQDCEFLACYYYLSKTFKSYKKSIGYVYFGQMGEDEDESLKVALVKCSKGSSDPGGSQNVAKNAVTLLRPKATFSVGFCNSLNPEKAKLGDVVISSKLTTDSYKTPVSRDVGNLVRNAADGWEAPLENPEAQEVKVHCDGEILSSSDLIGAQQQRQLHPEAIAVEMEGKGLFAAAHDLKIEWVVVKGVCDFADDGGSTNKSWKIFACVMAASVVSNMLSDSFVFADWPHYGEEECSTITSKRDLPSPSSQDAKRMKFAASDKSVASASEQSSASNLAREDTKPTNLQVASANKQGSASSSASREDTEHINLDEPFVEECQKQLQSFYATKSKVKIFPWDRCPSVHLNNIYTKLSWVKDDSQGTGEVTHEELEDYTDILKPDKRYPNTNRILVYGPPGIGKTVFTQKITYDWSQRTKVLKKFQLALLIKLRDVCNLQDIRAILTASKLLARDGTISVDDLYDYIQKNEENVLLILDGFDEYTFEGKSSPIVEIWEGDLLRHCHIIVTTREAKYHKLITPSHVKFKINGFDSYEQIKKFARKRLKHGESFEEFYLYLETEDLESMAKIPLLLQMLCIIWNERYRKGLPTSRADIYTKFIQILLHHKVEKDATPEQYVKVDYYNADLIKLGKFAFDALLEGRVYLPCSKLPKDISNTLEKLIEVGLFHILNVSDLDPEKGVYFIHKSVQEFVAAKYLAKELMSMNGDNTTSLSKVNLIEKISDMSEVFIFACGLSEEAACAVFDHLGSVGRKESLRSKFEFSETPSPVDFSEYQEMFLHLISRSYFSCSAERRRDLYSMFLSYTRSVLFLNSDQANSAANQHLLKSPVSPEFIFFSYKGKHSEQSYKDLITLTEDVNAVVATCSGEKKAADFLKKHPWLPLPAFFLKKERKTNLHISKIINTGYLYPDTFPTEMLRELISPPESTQKSGVSDQTNEQDINETASCLTANTDSTTGPTPHCLSCVTEIGVREIERQEMETLVDVLPFVTSLRVLDIHCKDGEAKDAQLTETLVSRINFTNRLERLELLNINLTARPAAVIARSLYQAPNLRWLAFSWNPLGEGVSVLTRHLRCVPHLEELYLWDVKMTKKQVNDLTTAVRQSNISVLLTSYHDDEGNVKPEDEWPTEEDWRERWKVWNGSEDEPDPGSVTESDDEQEPGSVTESDDEQEPGSVTESDDEQESGSVTEPDDEQEPGSVTESDDEQEPGS